MVRIAVIDKDKCNPEKCGWLCYRVCPINKTGKNCIIKDKKPIIDEKLCTGCGICQNRCPFNAITIVNLPEQLDKPIHRYGRNGFALYNLPIPIPGKIVGIIGKNGIGKTTAINILSGLIEPNLGKEKAEFNEIIKYFKGSEMQKFLEDLKKGNIKTSYKPQMVDSISRTYSGNIIDLLRRITNDDEKINEIANQLEIRDILNNDIKHISGGELQRVAIAATALKEANLYIFDEPTSYLDVKQRINVARFIRNIAEKGNSVVVVEHDLIILDYMADIIHIMYGKPSVYGVVSLPRAVRTGINAYLSGYLKQENIRFRDKKIDISTTPSHEKNILSNDIIVSWNNIEKTLDGFKLDAPKGDIRKYDVVGVLGENGIGKTTFVKMIAGIIKQDKGEINKTVSVSYKPQYLKASDRLVKDILKETIEKYKNEIILPLEIESLFNRKLNELSGGELQRVAIALCLTNDADLYLFDEPSAYLDVEQRLVVSKIIKDFVEKHDKSSLVVDHDIVFIDYISKRLIVFSGKPARHGLLEGPFDMEKGMNKFLSKLNITMRRDLESKRPRINKLNSQKDLEQKKEGRYYYV